MPKVNVAATVPEEDEDTDLREDLEVDEDFDGEELPEAVIPPVVPSATKKMPDVERHARSMGWHPQDEYQGPPGKWVDAETFVKRGQEILPVLRDNNKRLLERTAKQDEQIAELRRNQIEQNQVLKELREIARTSNERGYERARSELKAQQREAVANGDTDRFEKVTDQIEEIEKTRAAITQTPPPASEPPKPPAPPPEVTAFISDNPWFNTDRILNQAMQNEHVLLREMKPGMPLEDNLAEAKEVVMKRFPEKFGGKPRSTVRTAAAVAQPSGGRQQSQNNRKDTTKIDSIEDPAERAAAKVAFARYKHQMSDYTEEEYMMGYSNPHNDVLSVLRTKKEARRGK